MVPDVLNGKKFGDLLCVLATVIIVELTDSKNQLVLYG